MGIRILLPFILTAISTIADQTIANQPTPQSGSPYFIKRATWADTMLASRAQFQELRRDDDVELGPWYATAPLPTPHFTDVHFPIEAVDLSAEDKSGAALWTERSEWIDGAVHKLPSKDHAATYLFRSIYTTESVSLTASLGSDDGIEVRLNGTNVFSRDVPRGVAPDQDRVTLNLMPGENHLLMKIYNITGGHGFYFLLRKDPLVALWEPLIDQFPIECDHMMDDLPNGQHLNWFRGGKYEGTSLKLVQSVIIETGISHGKMYAAFETLRDGSVADDDPRWLELYVELCIVRKNLDRIDQLSLVSLRRCVEDLTKQYPTRYGTDRLANLMALEQRLPEVRADLESGDHDRTIRANEELDNIEAFCREALLANPLLDFDQLLYIRRRTDSPSLGLPQNWQGNCSLPRRGYNDSLCTLGLTNPDSSQKTIFTPNLPRMIADIDLHWDGNRLLFSMIGTHDRWQIFEFDINKYALRQVTPGEFDDVDNYDACYLPDGRIIFDSTRCFQGIPCVGGADAVANLYLMDEETDSVRQLCFDQDHNWCPSVLNNGRVLFTRWEYSDTPHYFTRLLIHMNPDGTGQMEYYGSNSYWPNSIFYARPIPNHPTQTIAIVSGHHGVPRMGELILFDPALGRFEADGVVQRIPGYGKPVEPVIVDQLVDQSWPRFLHPYPLSEKYFLVSCKPTPEALWGIYLVDIFDNMVLIAEEPDCALLEPVPLRATPKPPVIPDKVRLADKEATIFLADIYAGPGLKGVPHGTVKQLRVYSFHYGYNNMGGHVHVGVEGPWDIHRLLGTVPVYEDGSACFKVPANTPIAIQPLDAEGKAIQLMRSWFTAMPGEVLSCIGCHEPQNVAAPVDITLAARQAPAEIKSWYGPTRGFSFVREVQPVLDKFCVGCHADTGDTQALPDLSRKEENGWRNFTPSYLALHPYVRRPGPESDYHLLRPMEFHADSSELIQILRKGHHGVDLDDEAWDRLVTWIDLNVPDHGTWGEHAKIPHEGHVRRCEMLARYAGITDDPEEIVVTDDEPVLFIEPMELEPVEEFPFEVAGWPFDAKEATARRASLNMPEQLEFDLGESVTLDLVLIPTGEFIMGSPCGYPDESPRSVVHIDKPFYMGTVEVTCEQYSRFDPTHFNGYHDQRHKDHTKPGYPAHGPQRPVIRITWEQATAFCEWLSQETGLRCELPTEAQWEWACRAGTDSPLFYGDLDTDFSMFANLADVSTKRLAVTGVDPHPIENPNEYQDYLPKDARYDDGERLMCDVGQYAPNPWGLHDMHGNVCEWTKSDYKSYPYMPASGDSASADSEIKVVRGGSWRDRPKIARSSWRWGYRQYQPVYNVGFRVVVFP